MNSLEGQELGEKTQDIAVSLQEAENRVSRALSVATPEKKNLFDGLLENIQGLGAWIKSNKPLTAVSEIALASQMLLGTIPVFENTRPNDETPPSKPTSGHMLWEIVNPDAKPGELGYEDKEHGLAFTVWIDGAPFQAIQPNVAGYYWSEVTQQYYHVDTSKVDAGKPRK